MVTGSSKTGMRAILIAIALIWITSAEELDEFDITSICDYNSTSRQYIPPNETNYDHLSEDFLSCEHSDIELGCYIVLPNNSAYVPAYSRSFDYDKYVINENGTLYVCSEVLGDHWDRPKFPEALLIVSSTAVAVSSGCIILHLILFACLPRLRNLPGWCLCSLCISLLGGYACFLLDSEECKAGFVLYYFLLSSFFWMNILAYDVWRSLRLATMELRLSSDGIKRFFVYSFYGWGGPLVIALIALIANAAGAPITYQIYFDPLTCWFKYRQALLTYFVAPAFLLIILNVAFFVSSSCMISRASMDVQLWRRFIVAIRLCIAMGLTWLFGVIAILGDAIALWYISSVFNALQGVFIFFSFTLTPKTRKACIDAIRSRKSSAMPTQVSSSQQASSTT